MRSTSLILSLLLASPARGQQAADPVDPEALAARGPDGAEVSRLIGDASRLAFADRGRYVADTDSRCR